MPRRRRYREVNRSTKPKGTNPAISLEVAKDVFGNRSEAVVCQEQIDKLDEEMKELKRQIREGDVMDPTVKQDLEERIQELAASASELRHQQRKALRKQGGVLGDVDIRPESRIY